MNRKFALIAAVLILFGSVLGGVFGRLPATSGDSSITSEKISADYREALAVIGANHVNPINHEKVADSSIQGMLWTLDPHSSFFTTDEFRKLYEEQASQFYGIGVSILQHRDGVYVQSVIPGTPADNAGLRYGDRFLFVDGKDVREWSTAEVSRAVRGEKGTAVKIRMERAGNSTPLDFEIVRGGVPLPSIRNYFMLPNSSAGYVGLTGGFQETTADELDAAMADLKKQGMKGLVLDLRGNPGGLLPQAIEVTSRFIPGGLTVVSVKGRSRYSTSLDLKSTPGKNSDIPLVVLINGGSASASEIVAGAIQDYGRGVIVGTDSFGKGLVQRVFPLVYGTGLTLTTARYYTPFGRSLQRDYSNGSIYEYYTHTTAEEAEADAKPKPAGSPIATAHGRILFGGRGIEPDVRVPAQEPSPLRARINEAAFFFVRQAIAGKVPGFENYKVEKQNFSPSIQPSALVINDKLFEAFRSFTVADKEFGLSSENINSQINYAKMRLREELATANYSGEAGIQVLLESDPQVLKAGEAVAEAKKLVNNIASNR